MEYQASIFMMDLIFLNLKNKEDIFSIPSPHAIGSRE
jgi:hypothetical protein